MQRTPNKSQHNKLIPDKRILPPLLPGLELATFRLRVLRYTNKPSRTGLNEQQTVSLTPKAYHCMLDGSNSIWKLADEIPKEHTA